MRAVRMKGVTLIELMIVVAVVGILAAIAFPSYRSYTIKSNRNSDGKGFLMDVAQSLERFASQNNRYTNLMSDLGYSGNTSPEGYYTVAIDTTDPSGFKITATPTTKGGQNEDTCGALWMTATLQKGAAVADCW